MRRSLRDDPRGSFGRRGANWFALEGTLSEEDWEGYAAMLDAEHRLLREAVAAFPPDRLGDPSPKRKYRMIDLIAGVAAHDVYHAGQIALIKRLADADAS